MMILSPEEIEVLKLSCKVAAVCLVFSLIPATLVAWVLARKEFWGKSLFETLVFLPLVLPPVVPGYLLLQLFGNRGLFGQYLAPFGLEPLTGKGRYWPRRSWAFPCWYNRFDWRLNW
jgi:molybdate transport system permease protein